MSHQHTPHHPQYGDRLLDDATANAVYEAQGVVHQQIEGLLGQLHQLPDHDTAAVEHCRDALLYMAGSVGTLCGYLQHHTDLPLYVLCYGFSQHAYGLIDQWNAEYAHGGAAAVLHAGEAFLVNFQHEFDQGFIGL